MPDPDASGPSWKSPIPNTLAVTRVILVNSVNKREYTPKLHFRIPTGPEGPSSLAFPQKYSLLCRKSLCVEEGQCWAQRGSLRLYMCADGRNSWPLDKHLIVCLYFDII